MKVAAKLINSIKNSYRVRSLLWRLLFDPLDRLAARRPSSVKGNQRQRVVFARLDGIGDYVIWTSAFRAIDAAFPRDRFERILIAGNSVKGLAAGDTFFDRHLFFDRERLAVDPVYRYRSMRSVAEIGCDIFVNPTISRDLLWVDSMARCSGASVKIASAGLANRMTARAARISNGWYTRLVERPTVDANTHAVEIDANFANSLNGTNVPPSLPVIELSDGIAPPTPQRPFVVLFLGAQFSHKRWPIANFAAIGDALSERFAIVLAAGPDEKDLAAEYLRVAEKPAENYVGRLNLSELYKLFLSAAAVVTNDTSAAHIATAAKAKVAAIYPGAYHGRFFPYPASIAELAPQIAVTNPMACFGCEWNCIYRQLAPDAPKPCITEISVKQVLAAVNRLLES